MTTMRRLPWIPWALVGITAVSAGLEFAVSLQNGNSAGQSGAFGQWLAAAVVFVLPLSFAGVGAFVLTRRPGNRIGWLMIAVGLGFALGSLTSDYPRLDPTTHQPTRPFASFLAWIQAWIWNLQLIALLLLLLLFPTGELPSRRWKPALWVGVVSLVALGLVYAVASGPVQNVPFDNPYGFISVPDVVSGFGAAVALASLGAAALSVVVRFRTSRGVVRQQLKWFAFGASLAIAFNIATFWFGWDSVVGMCALLTEASLPIFMGIAILRYRLYDIDVLINRTLVYGSLTLSLAALYLGGVLLLQTLFRSVTNQDSDLAVALSTLAVVALFNPWRHQVQGFIDRRFYRRKYDASRILAGLQSTLRDEVELEHLRRELVAVVQETVQARHVSLWLP